MFVSPSILISDFKKYAEAVHQSKLTDLYLVKINTSFDDHSSKYLELTNDKTFNDFKHKGIENGSVINEFTKI